MGFKRFRLEITIRVLLITATLLLLVILFEREQQWVTTLIVAIATMVQIAGLIHFVERTNRKLTQFLENVRHSDFSTSFYDKDLGKSFDGLNRAFNEVIKEFKKNRAEKEEHYHYLHTVVQHVSIGIIAFRKDGKVDIFNNAIKRLFNISNLRHINELGIIRESLPGKLLNMRAGDKMLIKLVANNELLHLSVYATEFRMRGEEFLLVSLQNITSELEEKEIESWQKLIRVLTHEIMNSITPISSLASTVRDMLLTENDQEPKLRQLDDEDIDNIQQALTTIQSRGQGLLNFVETYRSLTRIPRPNFRYFAIKELFDRIRILMKPKMEKYNINCSLTVYPDQLMVTADPDLLEQVFINLLLNAIGAVKDKTDPEIKVSASVHANGRLSIAFYDNGYGITPDILDKIFMPFFTSRKDGSGIGLSLSRQIMHLHKGSISVQSVPGEGTVFKLMF